MYAVVSFHVFFFFNDTATTEIYTLSLHDALPISRPSAARQRAHGEPARDRACRRRARGPGARGARRTARLGSPDPAARDRKSTRLNSSHGYISYAVFCLKKKKTPPRTRMYQRNRT